MNQSASTRGGAQSAPDSPIRLIALDVDGTLLDSTGVVRPRVRSAVVRAIASGCPVVLATGRRLTSAAPLARALGISTLILNDGTVVFDLVTDTALFERPLPPESQRRLLDATVELGLPPILFESPAAGARLLLGPAELDNPETIEFLGKRPSVVRLSLAELAALDHIVGIIAMGDAERVEQLANLGLDLMSFSTVVWRPADPDFQPTAGYHYPTASFAAPDTSKGLALKWLAERLGIPLSATMAVGDYVNDVSLVAMAGWGVAMGNAVASVRAVAQASVADNEHDGVAEAIERWVLSE